MSNTEKSFGNEIKRIADEVMTDGTVENILRDKLTEGIKDAIDTSFRWGDLKKAIESRVKEVMVPYIESYDMSTYIVKLDEILGQIVDQTPLLENKQMLENFKNIMTNPAEKTISLEKLFDAYVKFCEANVDTSDFEITDGEYENFEANAEILDQDNGSIFDYKLLKFWAADQDDLSYSVRLSRWQHDRADGYEISYDANPCIQNICKMNDFEILLTNLSHCSTRLVWDNPSLFDEDAAPAAEPELEYR